jgi:cytochrome c553
MAKLLRWGGYAIAAAPLLLLVAAAAIWGLSWQKLSGAKTAPVHLATPTAAQLADAQRMLTVLRCDGCHGKGLAGDLFFDEPNVARIYAPNLTAIAAKASDEQLARAITQGIGTDGRALVIMPSATFARLDDGEVAALIAAIRSQPRTGQPSPAREVGILGRIGLVTGKFHTTPEQVVQYATKFPIDVGAQFRPGQHIAASNCAECHGADIAGGEAKPGLTAPDLTIAGAYEPAAFKTLMRTGVPPGGRKLKMMDEIARDSLSHMTDAEIDQLYAYLQARAQRLSR